MFSTCLLNFSFLVSYFQFPRALFCFAFFVIVFLLIIYMVSILFLCNNLSDLPETSESMYIPCIIYGYSSGCDFLVLWLLFVFVLVSDFHMRDFSQMFGDSWLSKYISKCRSKLQ